MELIIPILVAIICIIIYMCIPLPAFTSKVNYDYDGYGETEFPTTIFESSLFKTFDSQSNIICSMLPTLKSKQCTINESTITKYKYPVHLLKVTNQVLAVFNDGKIYSKPTLFDSMWKGPLQNSLPGTFIPLRMITLDPTGTKLIGVGYNNRAYIKQSGFESEWETLPGLENIIYLMFLFDPNTNENKYLVINDKGLIQVTNTSASNSGLIDYGTNRTPVLKLMLDINLGYMLAIDTTFQIRMYKDKDWSNSEFSSYHGTNTSKVCDILFDNDKLLYGCVFLPEEGIVKIMKQTEPGITSKFIELNKIAPTGNSLVTDEFIIQTKNGTFTSSGLMEEERFDNDINLAYQRQMLLDKKRLREFCKARRGQSTADKHNFELTRNIETNAEKIDKLNGIINQLIEFDPDQKPIQESVIGINK